MTPSSATAGTSSSPAATAATPSSAAAEPTSAAYIGTITASMVTDDGLGHFVVTTGAGEGTDTPLRRRENLSDSGGHNFLLVGNGGYRHDLRRDQRGAIRRHHHDRCGFLLLNIGDERLPAKARSARSGRVTFRNNVDLRRRRRRPDLHHRQSAHRLGTADFGTGVADGLTLEQHDAGVQRRQPVHPAVGRRERRPQPHARSCHPHGH